MTIIDPPPAPEGGQHLRAQDLKNKVCIIRPLSLGEWPPKDDKPAQPFVACDVWTLDRAGIVEHDTGVRVSWWKAVAQLRDNLGRLVACKPVEQDDRSIELMPLSGDARQVAERVAAELREPVPAPPYDPDEEPFTEDSF